MEGIRTALTIENKGGLVWVANGLLIRGNSKVIHTTIRVSGGTRINNGIYVENGEPIIKDTVISVVPPYPSQNFGINLSSVSESLVILNNVTVYVQNSSSYSSVGIFSANNTKLLMDNIAVKCYGSLNIAANLGGSATITNSSLEADYVGIINNAILDIKNSIVKGSGIGIFNSGVANIVVSQVVGKIDNRGSIKCFNVYDANYDLFLCQ